MRTITMDIPPQDVITRDNVSIKVNAVVYFRVIDANAAVTDVENYLYATSQLAQTTLAERLRSGGTGRDPVGAGKDQPPVSRRSSIGAPNPGGSRSPTSRSSRSTCPRR